MSVLEAFQQALIEGADDDALDVAAADVRRDSGPPALVEVIKMRIAHELGRGKTDLDVTALRFRLAGALEEVAKTTPTTDGAAAALEAATLCREVLNDGEAATRNLVHALKWAANDDATLKRAIALAGGFENASSVVEKALKRPDVKADATTVALLRRTLSRVAEAGGDKQTAFFEMLKAARKAPSDGLSIDDVNRLALATGRDTEAAAFFGALADDETLAERQRATILNKLGQTLERTGDKRGALDAYTKSLRFHESKAPKRAVERLAQELGVEVHAPIAADEAPDVTPPYDHVSGMVTMPETRALSKAPPPPPPGSEDGDAEIGEDDVVSSEAQLPTRHVLHAGASELTVSKHAAPDAHLRTAELHETMSPSIPSGASVPQPRAVGPSEITASQQAPRPTSVPPPLVDDEDDAHLEHALDPARLPSFDDQPALTSAPGVAEERIERAHDHAPPPSLENSDPALPPFARTARAPVLEPALERGDGRSRLPNELAPAASNELFPSATTPLSMAPGSNARDASASTSRPAVAALAARLDVEASAAWLDAKASAAELEAQLDAEAAAQLAAETAARVDARGAELRGDEARAAEAAAALHPTAARVDAEAALEAARLDAEAAIDAEALARIDGEVLQHESALDAPQLEAALANLPDRAVAPEEEGKTRRVPHAAGMKTAINTGEGNFATSDAVPSKRGKKKESKKEKTQKRRKPVAPGAPRMIVDNSEVSAARPAMVAAALDDDVDALAAAAIAEAVLETAARATPFDDASATNRARPAMVASTILDAARPSVSEPESEAVAVDDSARARLRVPVPPLERELHAKNVGFDGDDPTGKTAPERPDRDRERARPVEATIRSPAPQPHVEHVEPTAEAMPPLAEPAMSMPSMEASTALSRALAALDNGSAAACIRAATDLAAESPSEPRVLRLAGRALLLETDHFGESASLSPAAVALFIEHAPRNGDRATSIALEIREKLPTSARRANVDVWVAGAKAAGLDGARVLELLRDAAIDDAPDGPAFAHCEKVLAQIGDAQGRDSLYQAALKRFDVEAKRLAAADALGAQSDAKGTDAKSDAKGPDAKAADAKGPDAKGPDAKGPDAKGPDAKGPDAKGTDAKGTDAKGTDDANASAADSKGESRARGGARKDDGKRAALTKLRIALLEGQSKPKEALLLHAQLAVDLQSGDIEVRRLARRAFAEHGTPDERARFLARLARRLPGDEGIDVAQELLDVRLSVDDRLGAEAAAKDLLMRRPGDARGTKVLADLLDDDPGRVDELADILRIGAQQAMTRFGQSHHGGPGEARTLLERLAVVQARAGRTDEAADALVQVARLVPDEPNLEKALAALDELKRYKDMIALLEEAATSVADSGFRARTLLRAADIARQKLHKRGKARELVERALDLAPRDREALRALADLLVEIGDVPAAVSSLERLVTEEKEPKERARTHLRIGRLLEEHLLKPDDALKRYRVAAEMDPTSKDVWNAIRAVARQRGESALLVESLNGLAGAEPEPKEQAALWRQIAKVERDERADVVASEKAYLQALARDASDAESLTAVLALLAGRLQPDVDVDTALAQPNEALMDAVRPVISAGAARASLPLSLRRLHALALSRGSDRVAAAQLFEQLLVDHPEDLDTMMAFARHLAAAPRTEIGAEARRLRVLETILLHHAYSLKPPVQVDVWGDVTALRAATGDGGGARKAAKKVMALALTDELKSCLSDRAVRAVALALDDARDAERDAKAVVTALRLDADRSVVDTERCRLLERAAAVCAEELKDLVLARQLLEIALRANPQSSAARDQMLDLDLAVGDVAGALKQVRDALARETEAPKKAALHLRMFRLRKKLDLDVEGAAVELKAALDLDPTNDDLLSTAEQFFSERKDADGLDKLWSAQLRSLDREDPRARLKLLERLAQLRRYDRRDFAGAIEALEAMTSLDPDAIKPREDAARLYTELGLAREAVGAWRGVLERDPLSAEAWRGVLGRFAHTRQGDEAFAVASTMLALDIADHDIARVVRTIRPPFPRWPLPPKDPLLFRKKIAHPLERTPVKNVLDVVGPRLLPLYARDLKSFGLRRKDALLEKHVPTSVLLAVRTLAQLLNLKEIPPLYAGELGVGDTPPGGAGANGGPPFAALPSMDAGIIVTGEVLKGGMTPERAFALGRAASWLQPHAVLAAAVDAPTLRLILEGLVAAFLGPKNLERPDGEAEKLGKELGHALMKNRTMTEESAFKGELLPALRDYVHARQQVQVADWRAGVGYSGDRVGFLMSTDLNAAFRMIKSSTGGGQSIGARLAIKELVLFSVSSSYLALRKDLGLALPELAAAPLLDLG